MDYFFMQGNNYYLGSERFNEYAIFDDFGKLKQVYSGVAVAVNKLNVDIVSIINTNSGLRECEVSVGGKKKIFYTTGSNVLISLRKLGNYVGTIFSYNHNEGDEVVVQVFLAFRENVISTAIIDKLLGDFSSTWQDL